MCDCKKMELFNNGKNVMFPLSFGTAFQKVYYTEIKQLGKCFGKLLGRNLNFWALIQLKISWISQTSKCKTLFYTGIPIVYMDIVVLSMPYFCPRLTVDSRSLFFHTLKFCNPLLFFFSSCWEIFYWFPVGMEILLECGKEESQHGKPMPD